MLISGCGRLDFGEHTVDAVSADAPDIDTPPPFVCGDGVCNGDVGELCVSCASDCATTNPVCGNGQCDPSEDSTTCFADCGPTPWPWAAEETDLMAKINATRTAGHACPNGMRAATTALALGAFLPAAREWTWELAHQKFFMMGGTVCNGRTIAERSNNFTLYSGFMLATGPSYTVTDAALATWLGNPAECDALMEPTLTQGVIAGAHDTTNAFVFLLKQ